METGMDFFSDHFVVKKIRNGIFAAIHKEGGAAIGNAGIIDLGDTTLVFDTFISPVAAKDLHEAAKSLTGSSVSYVVNSHYHNDHIRGNQEFPNAQIISTAKTLTLLKTTGKEELASDQNNAPQRYQHYLAEMRKNKDQAAQDQIRFWLDYYRVIADSLDDLHICLPQRTFNDHLTLSGSARSVELFSYGGGHSGSDAFLFIPDESVLFLSDLLFVNSHPFLADGHPENWISILEKIKTLDATILVPGHGPVGSKTDLDLLITYIQMMENTSRTAATGETHELPPPFDTWALYPFYPINLGFMNRR
jgi:glyoxylase-like metal-dependent hydrolase (beta-lactamase superfamily II)